MRRRIAKRSLRCATTPSVASSAVRRFELQLCAAGVSDAMPSISSWLSPPIVASVGDRCSVSKRKLEPDLGGHTTKTGFTIRAGPANAAGAPRTGPAAARCGGSATCGDSAGPSTSCCSAWASTTPFGNSMPSSSPRTSCPVVRSRVRRASKPPGAGPNRAWRSRQSRRKGARHWSARSADAGSTAPTSSTRTPIVASTSAGDITAGQFHCSTAIDESGAVIGRDTSGRLRGTIDEVPQGGATDRVDHEVDARTRSGIVDPVALPGVEHPGLTGSHMHGLVTGLERHVGRRRHRYMQSKVVPPVVVGVDVRFELRLRCDAHEAGASDTRTEGGQHAPDVGEAVEVGSGCHRAESAVAVGVTSDPDEHDRRVARCPVRMHAPCRLGDGVDLGTHGLGVELQREPDESAVQPHPVSPLPGPRDRRRLVVHLTMALDAGIVDE